MLVLQGFIAILRLLFGLTAFAVALSPLSPVDTRQKAWLVTSVGFTISGLILVVQSSAAAWAYFSGPGTPVYSEFLRWSPAANHSRTLLSISLALFLVSLPALRRFESRFWVLMLTVFFVATISGGLIGVWEGPWTEGRHHSVYSVLTTAEVVVLLGVLFTALWSDTMDRLLWLCFVIYAIAMALNVVFVSALAWIGVFGAWSPSPALTRVHPLIAYTAMLILALRRLSLARRDIPVPALLEPLTERRISTLG